MTKRLVGILMIGFAALILFAIVTFGIGAGTSSYWQAASIALGLFGLAGVIVCLIVIGVWWIVED